jgi:hypothetical protein
VKRAWIRLYTEVIHDPKVCRLSDRLYRVWIGCLCMAAETDGYLPPLKDVAFTLRMNEKAAQEALAGLELAGLIDRELEGQRMHGWENRQYESDTNAAERMRRHRKNKRDISPVTALRNSDGPEQSRADTEQRQSRAERNAPPPPDDTEQQIRQLADQQPNPQDFEMGINRAVQEVVSSANPEITMQAMRDNLPLWWDAMREGRVRMKPLSYVITDRDYLRKPPAIAMRQATDPITERQRQRREALMKD